MSKNYRLSNLVKMLKVSRFSKILRIVNSIVCKRVDATTEALDTLQPAMAEFISNNPVLVKSVLNTINELSKAEVRQEVVDLVNKFATIMLNDDEDFSIKALLKRMETNTTLLKQEIEFGYEDDKEEE